MPERQFAFIQRRDKVAKIYLNNPSKRNNLNRQQIADFVSCYDELLADDAISVVITQGVGDAWCAGRNLPTLVSSDERGNEIPNEPGSELLRYPDPLWRDVHPATREYPKVTIAAVNGYCLGAAITWLIVHDLAIASEKAVFGLPEVMRGFSPRTIQASLFRAVPMKWAFDMNLTGDDWDARTAQMAGLVSRVVPHDQLDEAAWQWGAEIARWDPILLRFIKKACWAGMDEPTWEGSQKMVELISQQHEFINSKARQAGRDFLAKKGPGNIPARRMIKWVHKE